MRKVILSVAAAGAALVAASPAAAQYYPQPQPYGYGGQPYGQAYGYGQNNYGQLRMLQARIDRIQRQIEILRDRRMLDRGEAQGLREESRNLERRLRWSAGYGLDYREMRDINVRIARLEQRVRREASDGNRWGRGYGYGNGYNGYDYADRDRDRDRDGRDDRYEDDRGRDHDHD